MSIYSNSHFFISFSFFVQYCAVMDPGPTISRPYTRHKWVGRMICSHAIESACAQDSLRLPESMTIIKNRTDNLRFSFPLLIVETFQMALVHLYFHVAF